jgi:hypothetical protein
MSLFACWKNASLKAFSSPLCMRSSPVDTQTTCIECFQRLRHSLRFWRLFAPAATACPTGALLESRWGTRAQKPDCSPGDPRHSPYTAIDTCHEELTGWDRIDPK